MTAIRTLAAAALLLLSAVFGAVRAQEPAKQHRIAVVTPAGPVADISDTGVREWPAFYEELRRLGDIEGQNLTVDRYSGQGRPAGYPDLARQVVSQSPDAIVAVTDAIARAVRAATGSIPIVWIGGDPIQFGFAKSLARPGGNITGVTVFAGPEIFGKRLQILKEAVPSVSKVAFLTIGTSQDLDQILREAAGKLEISVIDMALQEATPIELQRVFAEIAQDRPDAVIVNSIGDLLASRQLIVELVNKNRLPAIYPWREYAEAGGLMAYATDLGELGRRMADDVHTILNGAMPGDIPIYLPTKYEFVINLKAAKALGLSIPPGLLATANDVIE
ncbi:MAG: ABC transporter substrate-binding protein [Alphaproteobacteria bacterium]|nr:ABC transporter substrate-binding protein [Alphaproteobacteria bacterium]